MKRTPSKSKRRTAKDPSPYPKGWDRGRAEALIDHYERQSDDDAIAEAEEAARLLEGAATPHIRLFIAIALYTAARSPARPDLKAT